MSPWSSLSDLLLAGEKRDRELDVEKEAEYGEWGTELHAQIEVFVKRVNASDLEDSADRQKFFSLVSKSANRFSRLRESSESATAPTDALIRLEELIERMENASEPISVGVVSLDENPFKRAQRKRREENRERKEIKRVREERDEIADHIQELIDAFE